MTNMYIDLPSLHQVMLDYTSKCNALCLRCARNVEGKFLNKNMPIADMPWNVFEAFFEPALNYINVLEYVGNFGDPALHPDLIKGIEWLRQRENPSLRQSHDRRPRPKYQIATNGGMNSPDWWRDLAKVLPSAPTTFNPDDYFARRGEVVFGIDGLEGVNDLYRRQVNWDKLMENVNAFIGAGGDATWQYILFEHNKHQVEEAREFAEKLGFNSFFTMDIFHRAEDDTGSSDTLAFVDDWHDKENHNREHFDAGAETKKYEAMDVNYVVADKENTISEFENVIKNQYNNDIADFQKNAPIECSWCHKNRSSLLLVFNGEVWPCCFVGGQRYPKDNPWDKPGDENDFYLKTHGTYGSEFNNLNNHSLQEILAHPWYSNDLVESFSNSNRMELCGWTCTKYK